MPDIVTNTSYVNLAEEAIIIRREFAAADAAGHARLNHAIEAGKHLIIVRDQIGRGFRAWLQTHGLKKSLAYNYILLAQHEESVHSSGHSSIAAALRMIRAESGKRPGKPKKKSNPTDSPLTKAAWTKSTHDEQQRFLDAVGVEALLKAISFSFRSELKRRVAGQQAATANADKFGEKTAKLLRHALWQQKNAKIKDTVATEVINALGSLNNLIVHHGHDLFEIVGLRFDRSQTIEKPATAKAAA